MNELVSNYIAPLLVASGGRMEGMGTVDDIQTAAQESNIIRGLEAAFWEEQV